MRFFYYFCTVKKSLSILFFLLLYTLSFSQIVTDSIWNDDVKSVFLSRNGIELEHPFIPMADFGNQQDKLLLSFDILWPQPYDLHYRIRHCNAYWQPDNLDEADFLSGPADGNIENYNFSFTTLQQYVNYYQPIPNDFCYFMASGNYVIDVFFNDNPDSIILSRRFCVYEDLATIDIDINKPSGAIGNIYKDQEVSVSVTPKNGAPLPNLADYYIIILQQNGRIDLQRTLPFNNYSGNTMLYQWHKENVFPGGNCFRYFDISNLWAAMYHVQRIEQWGGENFAFLQPDEIRARKAYTQYSSLNGGMKINIRERQNPQVEADYVWVNFSLPVEKPFLDGSVHIVGELTQWQINDNSRMEWNNKYKAYTKRLYLKQGYYAYQLLFLPTGEKEALTSVIEGDHAVMQNNYTVYVYLRMPGSRYDRLVGLK